MLKSITITVIPHSEQRYPTCGDWQFDEGRNLYIKVSDTGEPLFNFLLARHELDEAIMCANDGVSEKEVDEYDFSHPEAGGDCFDDNTDAPYYVQHNTALAAEYQMARNLGVDWVEYSDAVNALFEEKKDGNETDPR